MGKVKLLIPFVCFIFLVACGNEKADTQKEDDNTLKASVHTSIEDVSYEQAIEEADLIAEVSIKKIQGIVEGGNNIVAKTKFEGRIDKVYAGSKKDNDTISILQEGKDGMEVEDYPMFKPGEKYILMLMNSGDKQTYWIKGQVNGTYLVEEKSILKFGEKEEALPEKADKNTIEASIKEKQEETDGNSQILDTKLFEKQLESDVRK